LLSIDGYGLRRGQLAPTDCGSGTWARRRFVPAVADGAALSLLVGLLILDSEEHWLDFDQELVGLSLLPLVVDWVVSHPLSHYQIRVI